MSIRERKLVSGSVVYDVILDAGKSLDGKRTQRKWTCKTRAEAKRTERDKRAEIARGEEGSRDRTTLATYLARWLAEVKAVDCEQTTMAHYAWVIKTRINPTLGAVPLADLDAGRIQRWITTLATTPSQRRTKLSHMSVKHAFQTLHMALDDAAGFLRLLPRNPADGVRLPKGDRAPRKDVWSDAEAAHFLAVASQDAYEPIWTLAVFTGMRRAELIGLRWQDIDWDAGQILVRETRTAPGGRPLTKPPKNPTSRRPIPAPATLLATLAAHHERQALHREECADAYENKDLVCATPYGRHWHPDTISHRFKALVKSAGVPELNLHYTRHGFASIALAHGESLRAVSEVLGHADPVTTMRIYQHVADAGRKAVSDAVSAALMSQNRHDVSPTVTSKDEAGQKEAPAGSSPEEAGVRPWRLERQTFRSAISSDDLPTPLGTKRRRVRRHVAESALPEETKGADAG